MARSLRSNHASDSRTVPEASKTPEMRNSSLPKEEGLSREKILSGDSKSAVHEAPDHHLSSPRKGAFKDTNSMVYEKSFLGDSPEQGGLFLPSGNRKGRHVDNLTGGGRVAKGAGETGYRSSGSCFGLIKAECIVSRA